LEALPVPARKSRTPSYRLHKPSGQAVVTLSGKDVYLGLHGTQASRDAYDRANAEWLQNGRRHEARTDLVISELIPRYLEHVDGYYRSNEPRSIRLALQPLQRLYGTTPAADFEPLALKAVRREFIAAGICRGEVNKRTRRVVRLFKWCASEELVPAGVYESLRTVEGLRSGRTEARESAPVRPVADDLVDAVRPFVSRQVWAMIELQRLTGMRPGEACIMRTCDLVTGGKIWEYRPSSHKTAHHGKDRVIFLGPQAQDVVRSWLRPEIEAYLFQPREAEAERRAAPRARRKSMVQPSQRDRKKMRPKLSPGERYDTMAYHRAITRGCDRASPHPTLERITEARLTDDQAAELREWRKAHRWHPHQLRHSAATRLRREFGLDVARAVLGHSSPIVTEVYAELDPKQA
jgi:integrase